MASLAGRRRVSFDAPRQSRNDRLALNSNRFTNVDTSDEEEELDEEERLRIEEEDQERSLSAANGEAAEAPSSKKTKRDQTDQEIADEYASTAKKRKPRITLQPTHLTGADGLIRIRSDIGGMKFPQKQTSIDSAAAYSRDLVKRYKSWSYTMFPSLAFEDVLSRVETFGSKREIKSYLQQMREEVRNAHLEKLFGKEGAQRMIAELDDGLKQQHVEDEMQLDGLNVRHTVADDDSQQPSASATIPVPPPNTRASAAAIETAPSPTVRAIVDSDSEEELEFDKPSATPAVPASTFFDTDDEDEGDEKDAMVTKKSGENEAPPKSVHPDEGSALFDSDDEGEAIKEPEISQATFSEQKKAEGDKLPEGEELKDGEALRPAPEQAELPTESTNHDVQLTETANEPKDTNEPTSSCTAQTQATVLASQPESSFDDDQQYRISQTQATVLATQLEPSQSMGEEIFETQLDDDTDEPSQTQATVLATQPMDDSSFDLLM
jgi:hypothetical protein